VVAQALSAAEARIVLHHEHFDPGTPDVEWLPRAAREGWVVLTKDQGIRRKAAEREILLGSGARDFILSGGNLTGAQMGQAFVAGLRRMARVACGEPGAFIATVSVSGIVKVIQRAQAPRPRRAVSSKR